MPTDAEIAERIHDSLTYRQGCWDCKYWDRLADGAIGLCNHRANQYEDRRSGTAETPITTDLTLCSKWEQKDDEQ